MPFPHKRARSNTFIHRQSCCANISPKLATSYIAKVAAQMARPGCPTEWMRKINQTRRAPTKDRGWASGRRDPFEKCTISHIVPTVYQGYRGGQRRMLLLWGHLKATHKRQSCNTLVIGNGPTSSLPGKEHQLTEEAKRYFLGVAGISSTKRRGSNTVELGGHCSTPTKPHLLCIFDTLRHENPQTSRWKVHNAILEEFRV